MVSMSELRLRKPSIFINAFIASGLFIRRWSVALSTLTSTALSQRRASKVAVVPLIAISSTPAASISFIDEPSKASMGRNFMKSSTFLSGLDSWTLSWQLYSCTCLSARLGAKSKT